MTDKGIVIVGASHGGVQLAASLREKGYEGPLTMLTSEPDLPYQKPPLSKGYIKEPDPKPTVLRPEKFYTDRNIDLRLGTEATAIDKTAGSVTLADGNSIVCSRIALAVGLAIFAMILCRAIHPPAGAVAMTAAMSPEAVDELGFLFALSPIAVGTILLVVIAAILSVLSRMSR